MFLIAVSILAMQPGTCWQGPWMLSALIADSCHHSDPCHSMNQRSVHFSVGSASVKPRFINRQALWTLSRNQPVTWFKQFVSTWTNDLQTCLELDVDLCDQDSGIKLKGLCFNHELQPSDVGFHFAALIFPGQSPDVTSLKSLEIMLPSYFSFIFKAELVFISMLIKGYWAIVLFVRTGHWPAEENKIDTDVDNWNITTVQVWV